MKQFTEQIRKWASKLIKETANKLLSRAMGTYLNIYKNPQLKPAAWREENSFLTLDGRRIPVYTNYRAFIKKGFSNIEEIGLLEQLKKRSLLTTTEENFLSSCLRERTLNRPLIEIEETLKKVIGRHGNEFIPESLDYKVPIFNPQLSKEEETVQYFIGEHKKFLRSLKTFGVSLPNQGKLLEIGYTSGAHSLIAFERLGFKTMGVDNCYGGIIERPLLAEAVTRGLKSRVDLTLGDITKENKQIEPGSFNIIYSSSVIEHLQDVPGAFKEMRRLISDRGLLIHSYNPFFCPNGGHASGTLDSPWAHCRLSREDYLRYVKELRPYEFERTRDWILNALNPQTTISRVQFELLRAGFEIVFWRNIPAPEIQLADLTPEIASDCMNQNQAVTFSDLISQNIIFAARPIG